MVVGQESVNVLRLFVPRSVEDYNVLSVMAQIWSRACGVLGLDGATDGTGGQVEQAHAHFAEGAATALGSAWY